MSTIPPIAATDRGAGTSFAYVASPPTGSSEPVGTGGTAPELELIQEAKNQIRVLVQEITQLSQSDLEVAEFYQQFLPRVVSAMASVGGAVWAVGEDGQLQLEYQVNLDGTRVHESPDGEARHRRLLRAISSDGQPVVIPPRSGSHEAGEPGNPTDLLLVLALARVDQRPELLIEIFQRAGGGPTTHRGYLRFVLQMADLAGNFLRNRRLKHLGNQQTLWERLEHFLAAVHGRLDSLSVAYTLANDGRQLAGVDRLSVLTPGPRGWNLRAVSGLESIDRRSAEVVAMEQLAKQVAAIKGSIRYSGDTSTLPPQISDALHAYLDQAHSKWVMVLPMARPPLDADAQSAAPLCGILLAEHFQHLDAEGTPDRLEFLAEHGSIAIANAQEFESIFLFPVWRALGSTSLVQRLRGLSRWAVIGLGTSIALAGVSLFPVDFSVLATGRLQPSERHEVFAQVDGIVKDVPVRHEQLVQPGDLLVRLSSSSLEIEISSLEGRLRTTQERIGALQHERLQRRLPAEQQNQISGELLELAEVEISVRKMLELLKQKKQGLEIRSQVTGQIVTWRVEEQLAHRPVQRGQSLMTIVNPNADWELELNVPERRVGHITRSEGSRMPRGIGAAETGAVEDARNSVSAWVPVTYSLASFPGRSFHGRLGALHGVANDREQTQGTVLARVSVERDELPELRSGTTVTARIHCGRRPLGYAIFCDLIETIQSKVLFWVR